MHQPLSTLLDAAIMQKASGIAGGMASMDSILNCFYNDDEQLMQKKETLLQRLILQQPQRI